MKHIVCHTIVSAVIEMLSVFVREDGLLRAGVTADLSGMQDR